MSQESEECSRSNTLYPEKALTIKQELEDESYVDDKVFANNNYDYVDNEVKDEKCNVIEKLELSNFNIKTEPTDMFELSTIDIETKSTYKFELSTVDFKTELTDLHNNMVNYDVIVKNEVDHGLLFCNNCQTYYRDFCTTCGMLVQILNRNVPSNVDPEAQEELPQDILKISALIGQSGIFALKAIPEGVKFGPFSGLDTADCCWKVKGGRFIPSKDKLLFLNWMRHINPARSISERNLVIFQCEGNLYYRCVHDIQIGDELLVYFGDECSYSLNQDIEINLIPDIESDDQNIFGCTVCCLGFCAVEYLINHKRSCLKYANENFSIKDVMQCPFCNVQLGVKEYSAAHMSYCLLKRNRMVMMQTYIVNILNLFPLCTGDRRILVEQLVKWGLIPPKGSYCCARCGTVMKLGTDSSRVDRLRWTCGITIACKKKKRKRCDGYAELRTGTIFAGSKLSIFQILGFINLWVWRSTPSAICPQIDITRHTVIEWSAFCHELLVDAFVVHKEHLGGPGRTVEINESKLCKQKHSHGHSVDGELIFGGYERGTGRVFMISVEDRSVDSLLPVIRDWIKEGTTIVTDYWKSYKCLQSQEYEHLRVSRSLTFKDPDPGDHTDEIESTWRADKRKMTVSGRRKAHVPINLARYMFEKRCAELKLERTLEFLRLASSLYNPLLTTIWQRVDDNAKRRCH